MSTALSRRVSVPIVVISAFGVVVLAVPVVALAAMVPWSDLPSILVEGATVEAVGLSLVTASASAVCAVLVGAPLGYLIGRSQFRGIALLRSIVVLPVVMPPVVAGVALLAAFGPDGTLGGPLERWFGVTVPATPTAVVMAGTFVAIPFVVLAVESAARTLDPDLEASARLLGARPTSAVLRVVAPRMLPAIGAGAALAWARSLGEFGATITFAGDVPGSTRTVPLLIYSTLDAQPQRAYGLSAVLIAVSLVVLVSLRGRWMS